jgi:catechol 2,3-dioxygenase-like lactoylglutathione lyase family enzyme
VIDHLGFDVRDYEASKRFYQQALAPLGYELLMEFDGGVAGFGREGKPDFWIATRGEPQTGIHVAFMSSDRETVDRFYEAALAAGGTDNGPPGPRPLYHEHYYGAYVLDPDGNNVEAVCHTPEA